MWEERRQQFLFRDVRAEMEAPERAARTVQIDFWAIIEFFALERGRAYAATVVNINASAHLFCHHSRIAVKSRKET
jgi:hypothetical protein